MFCNRMKDNPANTDCEICIFLLFILAGGMNRFCPTDTEEEENYCYTVQFRKYVRFYFNYYFYCSENYSGTFVTDW